MTRTYPSLVLALGLALAAHLALLALGQRAARRDLGWWIGLVPTTPLHPNVAPGPPPSDIDLGDIKNLGKSINEAPGEQPLQSSVADPDHEQALMTRDPTGFARGGNQTAASALRDGTAEAQQASVFASQEDAVAQTQGPHAPPSPDALASGPLALKPQQHQGEQPPASAPSNRQEAQKPQQPRQDASVSDAHRAAEPGPNGKPAPSSDFESYPVATVAAQFVDGRVETQLGRKFKSRRAPEIGEAGWADLATGSARRRVVLRLKIDETGNVVDAQTVQSSGSDNVDLPCERAAVTWWFEPFTDPDSGKPHKQTIDFTITFE